MIERIEALGQEGHQLGICAVNVAEVLSGMLEHERRPTERLLSSLYLFEITYRIARRAGELQADLRRQGYKGDLADVLIGAVVLMNSATLLTANVRDFPLPGLKVERLPAAGRR